MGDDDLSWISRWYLAQCNGDWEHAYGITIETLDNPGWRLTIDLTNTALADRAFAPVLQGKPSDDLEEWRQHGSWCDARKEWRQHGSWCDARKEGSTFKVACGPLDLHAALAIFRGWAEQDA